MANATASREAAGPAAPAPDPDLDPAADGPLRRLVDGGWLLRSGVAGLFGFTPKFETAMARLQAVLTAADPSGSPGPHWYPPVVPLADIERAEYAQAFPHLLGTVHTLAPGYAPDPVAPTAPGHDAWAPADVVLAPAVCYGVYPQLTGHVVDQPFSFDALGCCYRHEATTEPGRFRSFRMREFVVVCGPDEAWQWRDSWIARCEEMFARLGLTFSVQPASDPFFGPCARFMSSSQIEQHLKYEFVVPLHDADPGTAIASANCHKDHLGGLFGIGLPDGGPAHSSCMAFGLERTILALVHAHGDELANWPVLA
jgi:seryl-tRNA synthetase